MATASELVERFGRFRTGAGAQQVYPQRGGRRSRRRSRSANRAARIGPALAALLLTPGCGAGDPPDDGGSVARDSAGVMIVESRAPGTWSETGRWRVAAEPRVEIGALEGAPVYQLHRARDPVLLENGRIVVANTGTQELRAYSTEGEYLWTAGGQGAGPGEFEGLRLLERIRGDSLLAYDGRHRRVSIFTDEGVLVRDYRPESPQDALLTVVAALDDGSLVGRTRRRVENDPDALLRDTLVYHLLSADGTLGATIGRFPAEEEMRRVERRGEMVAISIRSVAFARSAFSDAGRHGRIAIGSNDRVDVRLYDSDGRLRRVIRRPDRPPRELTDTLYDRYVEHRVATLDDAVVFGPRPGADQLRERLRSEPRVPALPAFVDLLLDDVGNLWMHAFRMPWEASESVDWSVYDRDGRLLGTVSLPTGLDVSDIADDAVIGIARDDLGVQYVRVYPLLKADG